MADDLGGHVPVGAGLPCHGFRVYILGGWVSGRVSRLSPFGGVRLVVYMHPRPTYTHYICYVQTEARTRVVRLRNGGADQTKVRNDGAALLVEEEVVGLYFFWGGMCVCCVVFV